MTPQLAMQACQDHDALEVLIDTLLEAGWLEQGWSRAKLIVVARHWAQAVVGALFKEYWSPEPWRTGDFIIRWSEARNFEVGMLVQVTSGDGLVRSGRIGADSSGELYVIYD